MFLVLPMVAGAALGGSLGFSGNRSRTTQTVDQTQTGSQTGRNLQRLDPGAQRHVDQMRQQGLNAQQMVQGQPGSFIAGPNQQMQFGADTMQRIAGLDPNTPFQQIDPHMIGAPGQVQADPRAGQFSFTPEQYDNRRTQDFMDPFEQTVVAGLQADFDRQRQMGLQAANQQATAAGAFGGSRGEVLQAQALDDVNLREMGQLAQVRSAGFQNAQQAGLGEHSLMQNLGFGAAQAQMQGQLAGAGMGLQAGLANQAIGLQAAGMNQQAGLQAGLANQQAQLAAAGIDMQGLGLALQGGSQLFGAGEAFRGINQSQLQEGIFRAQLGQDFLTGGLGPVGMDQFSTQNTQQHLQGTTVGRESGGGFNLGFGFRG